MHRDSFPLTFDTLNSAVFCGWFIGQADASFPMYEMELQRDPECIKARSGAEPLWCEDGTNPAGTKYRAVKHRGKANRKERLRTLNINNAFAELRGCIPHVPADTKLSKIKTLRLATRYIAHLTEILDKGKQHPGKEGPKADVKSDGIKKETNELQKGVIKVSMSGTGKKTQGRSGWPLIVWASEVEN